MPELASYDRSARFYDRLYAFKDYPTVTARLLDAIRHRHPSARTLLDVGCGTGVHLRSLQDHYRVEGTDLSPQMLQVARERCPEVVLHEADMATLDLGQQYDVVLCMFSSIGYVRTSERLRSTVAAFARHLTPGGVLMVEPWFTPEQYWDGHLTVNRVDEPDLQATWMYTSAREGDRSVFDIHYLVGDSSGVEHFTEQHVMGLFRHEEYLRAFTGAGLAVAHESAGFFGRGLYVGTAPGRAAPAGTRT